MSGRRGARACRGRSSRASPALSGVCYAFLLRLPVRRAGGSHPHDAARIEGRRRDRPAPVRLRHRGRRARHPAVARAERRRDLHDPAVARADRAARRARLRALARAPAQHDRPRSARSPARARRARLHACGRHRAASRRDPHDPERRDHAEAAPRPRRVRAAGRHPDSGRPAVDQVVRALFPPAVRPARPGTRRRDHARRRRIHAAAPRRDGARITQGPPRASRPTCRHSSRPAPRRRYGSPIRTCSRRITWSRSCRGPISRAPRKHCGT